MSACEANVTYARRYAAEPSRYLVSVSWQQRGGAAPASYQSELRVSPPAAN